MGQVRKEFKYQDHDYVLTFSTCDVHSKATGLGCHVASISCVAVAYDDSKKNSIGWSLDEDEGKTKRPSTKTLRRDLEFKKAVMAQLVEESGKSPFHDCSHRKAHIVLSTNYRRYSARYSEVQAIYDSGRILYTAEIIELMNELCELDPKTYGHFVMSVLTENEAHPDGSAVRTGIWVPPSVRLLKMPKHMKDKEAA